MEWLSENSINFKIIFTKEDKLKVTQKEKKAENYITEIFKKIKIHPEFIVSSSKTKKGRDEILNFIYTDL